MVNADSQNQDVQVNYYFPIDRYLDVHQPDLELSTLFPVRQNKCAFSSQDELLLKNLQKLLQSTAEELQVLSNQLNQRKLQAPAQKLPNFSAYDKKSHAQMIVHAKFNGVQPGNSKQAEINTQEKMRKMKDLTTVTGKKSNTVKRKERSSKSEDSNSPKEGKSKNVSVQTSIIKDFDKPFKTKRKATDRTIKDTTLTLSTNKDQQKESNNTVKQYMVEEKYIDDRKISIGYVEIKKGEEFTKSKNNETVKKNNKLEIQQMPSINIKTELTAQRIPSLEIKPLFEDVVAKTKKNNTAFIEYQYVEPEKHSPQNIDLRQYSPKLRNSKQDPIKKTVISSVNNISQNSVVELYKEAFNFLQKSQLIEDGKKTDSKRKNSKQTKTVHQVISDKWKTKRKQLHATASCSKPKGEEKSNAESRKLIGNNLTGTDYIPYSKLTLGGVKVSEIEKELSSISINKRDVPLSPIVNKILSSADNSSSSELIGQHKMAEGKTSMSTSDENLLQDVLSLAEEIKKSIPNNLEKSDDHSKSTEITSKTFTKSKSASDSDKTNNSYDDDDFEEELDGSQNYSDAKNYSNDKVQSSDSEHVIEKNPDNLSNGINNLSLKSNVDIFEFLHRVTTQDSATQIRANNTVSLKETQTTPREDTSNYEINIVPTTTTKTKSVSFDKDYIKNLVKEECGNFVSSKEIASFSKSTETEYSNIVKNVQTSPMHVKHTMTSPLHVADKSTSPFDNMSDDSRKKQEDISLNLSSPRFQLKLPQSSHEVLSNLNSAVSKLSLEEKKSKLASKHQDSPRKEKGQVTKTSSESFEDASTSDISSLGEVNLKLMRRKFSRKNRMVTTSESSTTSNAGSSMELHCERFFQKTRSDGELSLGQV